RPERPAYRARRVGQDDAPDPEPRHHAHGADDVVHRMALVVVDAAAQDQRAADEGQSARMAGHAGPREARDLRIRDFGRGRAEVEVAHPGAEHDRDAGDGGESTSKNRRGAGKKGFPGRHVTNAKRTPSKTSLPLTMAWLPHLSPRRDISFSRETMNTRSPGRTTPRKRTSSIPPNTTSRLRISGMNFL